MQVHVYALSFGSLCAHRSANPRGNASAYTPAKPETVATPDLAVRLSAGRHVTCRRLATRHQLRRPAFFSPTPHAAGRKLASFACPISPGFAINCDLPMINDRANWLRFRALSTTTSSLPSGLTDHYSLATRFTSHVPRATIVGVRRCRAPSWVQHSPPSRRQYATHCYVFGFSAEVWRAWFSAQLNIKMEFTSISLLTLVGRDSRRDSRPNCLPKKGLRRYEPRS